MVRLLLGAVTGGRTRRNGSAESQPKTSQGSRSRGGAEEDTIGAWGNGYPAINNDEKMHEWISVVVLA